MIPAYLPYAIRCALGGRPAMSLLVFYEAGLRVLRDLESR